MIDTHSSLPGPGDLEERRSWLSASSEGTTGYSAGYIVGLYVINSDSRLFRAGGGASGSGPGTACVRAPSLSPSNTDKAVAGSSFARKIRRRSTARSSSRTLSRFTTSTRTSGTSCSFSAYMQARNPRFLQLEHIGCWPSHCRFFRQRPAQQRDAIGGYNEAKVGLLGR